MATVVEATAGKIRDMPITERLKRVLLKAAVAAGIDTVLVTSGGQPGSTGRRTGSTRHDGGHAADLQLLKGGRALNFTLPAEKPTFETFVTAAAANGAIGIGAGVDYMGAKTIHVGFGTSPQDRTKLVWGAGGRSVNAPTWLRQAATKGWNSPPPRPEPATPVPADEDGEPVDVQRGRFVVMARGGLRLRGGPGVEFNIIRTLDTATKVTVVGYEGADNAWARVDLEGDRLIDGYLFAAFLAPIDAREPDDNSSDRPSEDDETDDADA